MPAYQEGPFPQRVALVPGVIAWSWGSFNTHDPGTRMQVTSVAISSNVATLAVKILEGYVPAVGQLVSVQGTQTATSGGGSNFNVTNVALSAVSINSTTGIGTISFALTSSNITTTTDSGLAIAVPAVTQEALAGSASNGQQFAVSSADLSSDGQRGITWFTQISGSPASVTFLLQGADRDADAYYTTIDTSTAVAGESRTLANVNFPFYRIVQSGSGGSSPTVAAGMLVR